jgi:quinol monooxygenase YgiN
MSFHVLAGKQDAAQQIIDEYFEALYKQGPGGMRSQCYASHTDERQFVHIKSFRRESVANQHFRSSIFRDYVQRLGELCGEIPSFTRLTQQQTFESIY